MITVTDDAKVELKNILISNSQDSDDGLRILIDTSGKPSIMIDKEQAGDEVVEHDGHKILIAQKELSSILDGYIVDCWDTENGKQLTISK